jgi:hypothetical protein
VRIRSDHSRRSAQWLFNSKPTTATRSSSTTRVIGLAMMVVRIN